MYDNRIVEKLMYNIAEKEPFQRKKIESHIQAMSQEDKEKLIRRIRYFLSQGESIDSLSDAYIAFCKYFVEERIHFVKTGTYRYTSLKETSTLYENYDYMHNYMIGLCMAIYMWQIQRKNMHFFVEACKEDSHTSGRYLEIGPGHGEYFVAAMENTYFDEYIGIDVSASSVKMSKTFVEYAITDKKKYQILHKNFFDYSPREKFQGIVMGEVLEHVENPLQFLKKIYELADEDALIFLSTAINSPYPDHIYHFHNMNEIYELFRQSKLHVKKEICASAEGISIEKAINKKYDIVVGFVLEKSK